MRAARHLCLRQKESSFGVSPTRRLWSRQFKTRGCLRHGKARLPSPHRSAGQSTYFGEQHVTPCFRHAPSAIAGSSTSAAAVAALTRSSTVNMNVSSIDVRTLTQVIVGHLGGPLSRLFCHLNRSHLRQCCVAQAAAHAVLPTSKLRACTEGAVEKRCDVIPPSPAARAKGWACPGKATSNGVPRPR